MLRDAYPVNASMTSALRAQFLGVSIWMFKDDIKSGLNAVRQPKATAAAAVRRSSIWFPILMM